ncbi:flagellar basal body rod protein FlgC [Chitinasiproducens palmae]|uniref:Flagellar basal-body rod protein FlgC n=1 Tax=Chitinasiproducens palmae TaxID=1770053 RepID=A0A1H2PKG3_9BURK|nr:flagellar basal body rod protein FlgC [Chitinasiproducens palmae]SDV46949.1 flagellar basal-body rod protein FlgC [Chitinasiproducens palmae]
MSFRELGRIAASAMQAQTLRLNTIASNLANADSAASSEASAYRARRPVFAAAFDGPGSARVAVREVRQSDAPVRRVSQPGHPLADANGDVFYPNVDPLDEVTDMMSAAHAYTLGVDLLARGTNMQQALLRLGRGD